MVAEFSAPERNKTPTWFWWVAGGVAAVGVAISLKNKAKTSAPAEQQAMTAGGLVPIATGDVTDVITKLKNLAASLSSAFGTLEADIKGYIDQLSTSMSTSFQGLSAKIDTGVTSITDLVKSVQSTEQSVVSHQDLQTGFAFFTFLKQRLGGQNTTEQWIEANVSDCVSDHKVDWACVGQKVSSGALNDKIKDLWVSGLK
ncbi:MAG: hypothetical protein QXZ36_03660 [Thermoproteota archaeon]